jgi:arylsulfatase A-like enzyme
MKRKILMLCAASALLAVSACGSSEQQRPNVLLILIDTVRADNFSCYGYHRETTPHIDSLAAAGTLALNCHGQSSWTLPAMSTIFTGVSPVVHGAGKRNEEFYGPSHEAPWLPLSMHQAGYRTAAFFNVIFMNQDFGFHRGFDHFDCQGISSGNSTRTAGETVDALLEWLDDSDGSTPFFAAVHFYDPHVPYSAPEPYLHMYADPGYEGEYDETWGSDVRQIIRVNSGEAVPSREDLDNLIALWDGEITYTDAETGRLLAGIRERGYGENTLVIVVGDHGEEFLEHGGIEHGRNLYRETTHVPLVIAGPGFGGGRVISEPVAQLDLAATVAAVTGTVFPVSAPSTDLSGMICDVRGIPASGVLWRESGDLVSVVSGSRKVIWAVEEDSLEAYDIQLDPGETVMLEPWEDLVDEALYYWATPPVGTAIFVDYGESVAGELRNLGYIR